jgi:linoleoyl-CoA desaturase
LALATKAKFHSASVLHQELKARVARYFADTGKPQRDLPHMYVKTAVLLAWSACSWTFLVFFASNPWSAMAGCLSLALAVAGLGFSVQHDANHGAYSDSRLVNRSLGVVMDLIGASSYVWRWKHNIFHHSHPNVAGLDSDVDLGAIGRIAPAHRHRAAHRLQYLYLWPLYGFLAMKWHFLDDVRDVLLGSVGGQKMPRPRGRQLAMFVGGKLVFIGWALVIPALFHPLWQVALGYAVTSFVLGLVLSVTFQLAHCVEEAEFPQLPTGESGFDTDWAAHQIRTTVDFAPRNRVLTWYLGGLNFQVVHHLFPSVCHLHYPALARIVDQTCREHGVQYRVHRSLGSALGSHVRWLKRMGQPTAGVPSVRASARSIRFDPGVPGAAD